MTYPYRGLIPQPYHHMMLGNPWRMAAFRHGIGHVVRPGDVVLEAGTGSGILAMMAARAGARRVYALELNPDLADLARRTVAHNGLADVVTVVEGDAAAFDPPEPIDVVIAEMLHVALVNEPQVPVMRAIMAKLARTQDVSAVRTVPFAAVSAAQLMAIDFTYDGFEIPLVRSHSPYLDDPRLAPVSDPVTYWVCQMARPETRIDVAVPLMATRAARVNAVQLITKAVMTERFPGRDNDWYLFQLQVPLPPRDVADGATVSVALAYDAGCDLTEMDVRWA